MKLLEIIKAWYTTSEDNSLTHFDLQKIEDTILAVKSDPFLIFMQSAIEEFLYNISVASKEKSAKKFYVINGVSGSGKTNFVYEILKDYLLATDIIKNDHIEKIASHELVSIGLKGHKVEDVLNEKKTLFKDGILIFDEFTTGGKNSQLVSAFINELYNTNSFNFTAVILMGEFRNNSSFIKTYNLEDIFHYNFRLNFYTPNADQIVDIFKEYVKREGYHSLTEKAISSLIFYFSKAKTIKETKFRLHKAGTLLVKYPERTFTYTSEMFPIYKEIVRIKDIKSDVIDQKDVLSTNLYKKLITDLENLKEYIN